MHITIEHHGGQYPSFNVNLHSSPTSESFLSIKGCRLASGSSGQFVSYPSRKQDNGKYWNHVWANDAFNAAVLAKVLDSTPQQQAPQQAAPQRQAPRQAPQQAPRHAPSGSGFGDIPDDLPPF